MLYVFHVDVGRMMSFDMTVALSSVENLKDTIERLHNIPASNIVLLVSGGNMLTELRQVSYYSAGTDTNPIYMFLTGDARLPPTVPQVEPDLDLREQVDRCLELPAVYDTVMKRAQLALKMYEMARDEERLCERLVHEQHLQQQGWSAVVANMEDLTNEFRQRFRKFCAYFDQHLARRDDYLELLHNFKDDLTKLERIPILPGLKQLAEADFHGFDEFLDTDEVFSRSHNQVESVLMAGGEAAAVGTENKAPDSEGNTKATVEESTGSCSDDKSSTSPNKKLKMGNESNEEREKERAPSVSGGGGTNLQSSSSSSTRRPLNLLQWITSKGNHNSLQMMSDECVQGLQTFNEEVYAKQKSDGQQIIKLAEQGDVKEIKGLGDRLCRLEEFIFKIKGMVQDQKELSTAFQQNQNRAIDLRDPSILPDLCASHQNQLAVMLQNHQKIREHRRCIAKAKDELGTILHTRLRHIVWIENNMSEFDNRLLFYHRCLRRAERHINVIDQIHQAPCIYVAAVTEVVRRKIFSGEFRLWATKLAEDFQSIHSEEIKRRQQFNASFEGHFLNILFPGMNDMPPAFAENPLIFDARLPNITKSDMDVLSTELPDLTTQLQLPDMRPVINFFVSRSGEHQKDRWEELIKQQVEATLEATVLAVPGGEKPLQHQRLSELQKEASAGGAGGGGCDESETDTETEFETVPSSAPVVSVQTSTSENQKPTAETLARSMNTEGVLMQSAETLTEENESTMRSEIKRLQEVLTIMNKLTMDCLGLARNKLLDFRTDTETYRIDLQSDLEAIKEKTTEVRMQYAQWEQQIDRVNTEHDQELQTLHETLAKKVNEIEALRQQMAEGESLQIRYATLDAQVEELRDQLKTAQADKESAVKDAREKLINEHKTEIESLRSRFRLMTSMDRSPSDTSLEKIEHPLYGSDLIERAQHEALMAQLRTTLEAEKERAVMAAVEAERAESKKLLLNSESVMCNVNMLREMVDEKERQLEQLRERDLMRTKENYQLKMNIAALTNEEGNSWLKEKIDFLNRDKNRLEEELKMERSRRMEMERSFTAARGPAHDQVALPRDASQKSIALDSCGRGDIVLVVWNVIQQQFMVVQDSTSLYFVHGDSLADLNLQLPPRNSVGVIPMPYYAIGRVVEKQYCQARKEENRYRLTRGSKFYRVKLEPLVQRQSSRRERLESLNSRSISQCESQSESSSGACALPPTPSNIFTVSTTVVARQTIATTTLGAASTTTAATTTTTTALAIRDVTDSSNTTEAVAVSTSTQDLVSTAMAGISSDAVAVLGVKERTVSGTSVAEDDDAELSSFSSERFQTINLIEEVGGGGDGSVASRETEIPTAPQPQQQQSVITEQPTSINKCSKSLIATPTITTTTTTATTTDNNTSPTITAAATSTTTITTTTTTTTENIMLQSAPIAVGSSVGVSLSSSPSAAIFSSIPSADTIQTSSPTIPTSVGTTSEDSDEYRSLECKEDDADFAISE